MMSRYISLRRDNSLEGHLTNTDQQHVLQIQCILQLFPCTK